MPSSAFQTETTDPHFHCCKKTSSDLELYMWASILNKLSALQQVLKVRIMITVSMFMPETMSFIHNSTNSQEVGSSTIAVYLYSSWNVT